MPIISERDRDLTMNVLQENIAILEWTLANQRKRGINFKLPKLIERNKKQYYNLKSIK